MDTCAFLLVDDNAPYRQILQQMIEACPHCSVVAQTDDGAQAARLAALHHPDVALVDVVMPDLDGIQATQRIKAASPSTRVIVYTAYRTEAFLRHALAAGADAFFWKEDLDLPVLETLIQQWFPNLFKEDNP